MYTTWLDATDKDRAVSIHKTVLIQVNLSDMKNLRLIAVIILLNSWMAACTKAGISGNDSLQGKWELRKTINGWTGTKLFPAGNGNTLSFNGTRYERRENGLLADSGTYKTYKDQSVLLQKPVDRIEYIPASLSTRYFFEWDNGQLVITMDVYDGVTSYYERVKE